MATVKRSKNKSEVAERKERAISFLKPLLPIGSTVYTVTRHRFRDSGGRVSALLIPVDGRIKNISAMASDLIERPWDDRDGIVTRSEFDLVEALAFALHGSQDNGVHLKHCIL